MAKQKTVSVGIKPKSIYDAIDNFTPKPMPGRFFAVSMRKSLIRKRPEYNKLDIEIITPGTDKKKAAPKYIEDEFLDHPNQMIVVAVGDDLSRADGYFEKMVVKKGDVIAFHDLHDRPPLPGIIFEGHVFYEMTQNLVIAILGTDEKFEKVETSRKRN